MHRKPLFSRSSSESPSSDSFSGPDEQFSCSTETTICSVYQGRCVVCLRRVGDSGKCAYILDLSDEGTKMVTYGTAFGILGPNFSRSAVENGLFLCASCDQDFFMHPDARVFLSLPRQVLQYLIKFVEEIPKASIHEFLDILLHCTPPYPGLQGRHIPDPQSIQPYLGLYTLVTLNPSQLGNWDFHIHVESEVSELNDGVWTVVPPNVTPSSSCDSKLVTARIYDPTTLSPTDYNAGCDLRGSAISERRFWRLPNIIMIAPILTHLLYSLAFLSGSDTNSEELRLAIKLRSLLALQSLGLSNDPDVGGQGARKRARNV